MHRKNSSKIQIHLIRGESSEGDKVYHYLAIYADRVRDMKLSLMTRTTDLEKFGVVVASGEGEPDEDTKNYIEETFFA